MLDDFREQSFSVSKKACPWEKVFSIHLEAGFVCVIPAQWISPPSIPITEKEERAFNAATDV